MNRNLNGLDSNRYNRMIGYDLRQKDNLQLRDTDPNYRPYYDLPEGFDYEKYPGAKDRTLVQHVYNVPSTNQLKYVDVSGRLMPVRPSQRPPQTPDVVMSPNPPQPWTPNYFYSVGNNPVFGGRYIYYP